MHVYSRHGSPLLVAEHAADERSVTDALRQFDPDLVLTWEVQDGQQVWEVHKVVGCDRPAVFICRWQDDRGTPLPLSHSLVDLVRKLRHGGVEKAAEEANARLRADADRETYEAAVEVFEDGIPRVQGKKMSVLHRGVHLRRARHKPGGRWSQ